MTPITQPYVFPYEGLVPEDRVITGIDDLRNKFKNKKN
jgi:hypothetical protein